MTEPLSLLLSGVGLFSVAALCKQFLIKSKNKPSCDAAEPVGDRRADRQDNPNNTIGTPHTAETTDLRHEPVLEGRGFDSVAGDAACALPYLSQIDVCRYQVNR
jgi:hypothetical protein